MKGVRGFFDFSFDSFQRAADNLDFHALTEGNVRGAGGVGVFREDADEVLHLLVGDFQEGAGGVVHEKSAFHFAGIHEVQRPGFLRAEEDQGVVGRWDEVPDFQLGKPQGDLLPLSPSGDDDEPGGMLCGVHVQADAYGGQK